MLPCKAAEFNELQACVPEAAGTHPREYSHPGAREGLHTKLLKWKHKSGSLSKNCDSDWVAHWSWDAPAQLGEEGTQSFLYPLPHSHLRAAAVKGSFRAALHDANLSSSSQSPVPKENQTSCCTVTLQASNPLLWFCLPRTFFLRKSQTTWLAQLPTCFDPEKWLKAVREQKL